MFARYATTPFAPCQDLVRQNRLGLRHIAAIVATTTLSTPWLDFVLAWISSFRLGHCLCRSPFAVCLFPFHYSFNGPAFTPQAS